MSVLLLYKFGFYTHVICIVAKPQITWFITTLIVVNRICYAYYCSPNKVKGDNLLKPKRFLLLSRKLDKEGTSCIN